MRRGLPRELLLAARRPVFALDATRLRRYWNGGDVIMSHLFNAGSILFEVGERFFIDVLREHGDSLTVASLQEQVRGFIGQEANHRRVHVDYNNTLAQLGYEVDALRRRTAGVLSHYREKASPLMQLAMVAGCEHLTASLSSCALSNDAWLGAAQAKDDAEVARFWRWHCAEEIEHKTVVLDVYRARGGGYWRRVYAYLRVTRLFFGSANRNLVHLLRHDGQLFAPRIVWRALVVMLVRPGALWQLFRRWAAYFLPGYDPGAHDEGCLIQPVLQHLQWSAPDQAITGQGEAS
jgi:predicted metal-dependent hydrolase